MLYAVSQTAINKQLRDTFASLHRNWKFRDKVNFDYYLTKTGEHLTRQAVLENIAIAGLKDTKRKRAKIVCPEHKTQLQQLGIVLAIEGSWFDDKRKNQQGEFKTIFEILNRNNNEILFSLNFKELRIYDMRSKHGHNALYYDDQDQSEQRLSIDYCTTLSMKNVTEADESLASQINTNQYSGLFSIQRLYLNLQQLSPIASKQTHTLLNSNTISQHLTRLLHEAYQDEIGISVGETLIPDDMSKIPTVDERFMPKHVSFSTQFHTGNPELSALIYHISTEKTQIPVPTTYPWDWFNGDEKETAGKMLVSKQLYLQPILEALTSICKSNQSPHLYYQPQGYLNDFKIVANLSTKPEKNIAFSKKEPWLLHVNKDCYIDGDRGPKDNLEKKFCVINWDFNLKVMTKKNTLKIESEMQGRIHCDYSHKKITYSGGFLGFFKEESIAFEQHSISSVWFYQLARHEIKFKTSSKGNISLLIGQSLLSKEEQERVAMQHRNLGQLQAGKNTQYDANFDSVTQQLLEDSKPTIDAVISGKYLDNIINATNKLKLWVFPGGKSLSFHHAALTDGGDLLVQTSLPKVLTTTNIQ